MRTCLVSIATRNRFQSGFQPSRYFRNAPMHDPASREGRLDGEAGAFAGRCPGPASPGAAVSSNYPKMNYKKTPDYNTRVKGLFVGIPDG
jgi:hypothetical protein